MIIILWSPVDEFSPRNEKFGPRRNSRVHIYQEKGDTLEICFVEARPKTEKRCVNFQSAT